MNMSPQQLVQNVLLGPGVTVSNIQFTGAPISIGYFGGNSNVGIKDGIVITTGTVNNNGNGPHGPNISPSAGEDNFAPGSALLASQLGGQTQTYNAATLNIVERISMIFLAFSSLDRVLVVNKTLLEFLELVKLWPLTTSTMGKPTQVPA
jgi:hypothetical protein